jgi:hypothetical protein
MQRSQRLKAKTNLARKANHLDARNSSIPEKINNNTLRSGRQDLLVAFTAGVIVGLGLAVSRRLRDIASLVTVGSRLYLNLTDRRGRI